MHRTSSRLLAAGLAGVPVSPLLLWFGAGILVVIGIIRRGSEIDE